MLYALNTTGLRRRGAKNISSNRLKFLISNDEKKLMYGMVSVRDLIRKWAHRFCGFSHAFDYALAILRRARNCQNAIYIKRVKLTSSSSLSSRSENRLTLLWGICCLLNMLRYSTCTLLKIIICSLDNLHNVIFFSLTHIVYVYVIYSVTEFVSSRAGNSWHSVGVSRTNHIFFLKNHHIMAYTMHLYSNAD